MNPLISWFVHLGVRVPQVGNHCTTGSVTVRPAATSQLIYQQLMYNTSEVVKFINGTCVCSCHRTRSLVYITDWIAVNFNDMFFGNHISCYHSAFSYATPVINITFSKNNGQITLKQYAIHVCEAVDVGLLKTN